MKPSNTLTLFLLFSLFCTCVRAQSDISATVIDTTGTTLPGANAILLRTSDTLLTSFGTTDNDGRFLMKDVPTGKYLLRVSFLGYERPDQDIEVTASDQYLGLGELKMYPAGFLLNGVEVTADRIPIRMKGDTMMYDADAFAVGDNAAVEDLLRRLPGMSIDASGQITWRGKVVQEVMINGKPFFAGSSTLITQNLDAKAVKNVEVFDQKSNKEELSGVDDGTENTTINLEMKEDFKAKFFGEVFAGAGTQERYDGGGKLFRISDASQFGALGTINNVNRVGFTGQEMMNYNRSVGQGSWYSSGGNGQLPIAGDDQTPGQNRSIAAGLNYGIGVGKGQLQLGYSLFDRELTQIARTREAFNREGTFRQTISNQLDATDSYSHRITASFEQDLDTTSRLDINLVGFIVASDDQTISDVEVTNAGQDPESYTIDQNNSNREPGGRINLDYSRRLGKPGRTVSVNAKAARFQAQDDLNVLTTGLTEELAIPGALINGRQLQDRGTLTSEYGAGLDYEEPLGEKWRWESELSYEFDSDESDFNFRFQEQTTTNLLTRNWEQFRGETGLVHTWGKGNNLSVSGNYYRTGLTLKGDEQRDETFNYFLPNVRFRIRSKKGFYNLYVRGNPRAPSTGQLQTIARPGRGGRVSIGNPLLNPAVNYSGGGYLWYNDQFRAISLNLGMNAGYTDNAFGNSVTFTEGQQIYQTVNVSHSWNSSLYSGATIGMDFINGELRVEANGSSSSGQGFVDGESRGNTTTNFSGGANITTEFNEKTFLKGGYTYRQSRNAFDDDESPVIKTVTHDLVGQFELEVSPKWRFETMLLYRIYEAAAFAGATNVPDLRASLEIRPFKKAPHYFRISSFDLLDQNTVINRQAQAFVTSETTSDALGRYFVGTFHYKFR